ncbi:MAG: PocR ligand-binding domain-containing protein [Sandaracinaceae bacterium]|nr:PocR ligand-binding domain-containing protein [Sandaracinaceae bacterium]
MSEAPDLMHADVSRLEDIVDKSALAEVCRSFFELFSIPIRVFSRDGALLADAHETRAICTYVNTLSGGRLACSALVGEVKNLDPEGTVEHPCFTGAIYRVVPIQYQGRRLGRFVVGPYFPAELRRVPGSLLVIDDGIDGEKARRALGEMPRVREETAKRLSDHLTRILDLIIFSGHRSFLTSEMHVASVRESFRALAEKNAALQEAYDKLRELDRLKSNFLATVSHELRTPLTSIIGYSDMLATGIAGELNEEQAEFVDTIRGKGDHLLALISSLLDLGKLEQGKLSLSLVHIDVPALIEEVAKTLAPAAAKREVQIRTSVDGSLPIVKADPVRLRQVLFNLTENAVKFSPRLGTVTLSVRGTEVDADGEGDGMGLVLLAAPKNALELSVSDQGPGIAAEEHAKIFDAFYQVDGSSTREHGGTGLGLSIVKRLVDAHGGSVWVESEVGKGTTFRFTILEADED